MRLSRKNCSRSARASEIIASKAMKTQNTLPHLLLLTALVIALPTPGSAQDSSASAKSDAEGFIKLFSKDGAPEGWVVRAWNDVKNPPDKPTAWKVENGILHGGEPRGSWLMSEKEYENFVLEFEFKLGATGNSGCALRAPMGGDPAFDGLELQMADLRYNPQAKDSELTGGIYRAIAPTKQVYKPAEWNRYQVTLKGPRLKVVLNGQTIQDVDLTEQKQEVKRHDGTMAPAVKDRPRQGTSVSGVEPRRCPQIRNARIKVLE
jgi:hypothetical protein